MPGLVLFGRRWGIGSDDFVFPGLAEIFVRFVWLIAISVVFSLHQDEISSCSGGTLLQAYYIGILSLLSINMVLVSVIVYTSMQGYIMYPYPRKRMPRLLYIKMGVSLPEFVWNVLGTYWSFGLSNTSDCEPSVVMTVRGAVLCGWVMAFVILVGLFIVFDPLGGLRAKRKSQLGVLESDTQEQMITTAQHAAKKTWETRCKLLCCCVVCDDQSHDAFSEIAKLLTDFFQNVELDLVATDIAAGLILVHHEQELGHVPVTSERPRSLSCDSYGSLSQETRSSQMYDSQNTNAKTIDTPTPGSSRLAPCSSSLSDPQCPNTQGGQLAPPQHWMTTQTMSHYMKYAMASYGWPLFVFADLSSGLCKLCGQCRCTYIHCPTVDECCVGPSDTVRCKYEEINGGESSQCCSCVRSGGEVHYDNCCQCHTAAIRKWTNVEDEDLIYVSFYNKIYAIPFFVAVDRSNKSVVVSIRGTLSLKDALTDLSADCVQLENGEQSECKCHKGIYQAACYIRDELQKHQILDRAFQQNQGARLVITGHSLGAGAAALLAILLKPHHPDLICFAFSPPGGLLSYEASVYCSDYVCSVVLGRDLVPRLGVRSMEQLKSCILTAIRRCERPKYQVIASGLWQALCSLCPGDNASSCGCRVDQPLITDNGSYITGQRNVEEAIQSAIMQSEQCQITFPPMYPPGRVMHIVEVDSDKSCCSSPTYFAEWKSPTDFQEILVSPDMLTDHLPDAVWKALEQLANKHFTPKPHYVVADVSV